MPRGPGRELHERVGGEDTVRTEWKAIQTENMRGCDTVGRSHAHDAAETRGGPCDRCIAGFWVRVCTRRSAGWRVRRALGWPECSRVIRGDKK